MNFEDYLTSLPKRVKGVKAKILKELWATGEPTFPREWVLSSRLLELTGQKYFDRRIRELRDEVGCDIQTGRKHGHSAYRLNSSGLGKFNPRGYLSVSQRNQLFREYNHRCAVCDREIPQGEKGLQADHKVPLIRKGKHELSNWQPLCTECNVAKRRACQGCRLECKTCSWAFPAEMGTSVVIRLDRKLHSQLSETDLGSPKGIEDYVTKCLEHYLDQSG